MITSFKQLVGNTNNISLIQRMLKNNTFSKFTVFEGVLGTGKSTSARIVAMRLTCENPIDGEPCCQCNTCKMNIKALGTSGESSCVKIINCGNLISQTDVQELIKNMFVLKAGDKPTVYLLEEAHALKDLKGAQTAFLEEIDRIQDNTYVIMCTTRAHDILEELLSRAQVFTFKRLNKKESETLVHSIAGNSILPAMTSLVVKHSKGIPRNIVNSIDFIKNNSVTVDEYREFINEVSTQQLLLILECMNSESFNTFMDPLQELMSSRSPELIFNALKGLLMQMVLVLKGRIDSDFSDEEVKIIRGLYTASMIEKALAQCMKYTKVTETELMFLFYQIRLIFQQRTVRDVYVNSSRQAAEQEDVVKANKVIEEMSDTGGEPKLRKLSVASLTSFTK